MRNGICCGLLFLALPGAGAERAFDFGQLPQNQTPPGFRSTVVGKGKPGDWRIIQDETVGSAPATNQTSATGRMVLAQLSQDPTDEHFPMLIFDEEVFGDFTLTTRFKTVRGVADRMAGIAFRIQNETNFYVIRASSPDNTLRFYKVVDGERGPLIGPKTPIPSGVWHDLSIECQGNRIRCRLNGQELLPPLEDSSFSSGKVGFWTKSDSVSYFGPTRIAYKAREVPAQVMVREVAKKYSRLLGLQLYIRGDDPGTSRLLASKAENEIGQAGSQTEVAVIRDGTIYYGKEKDSVSVVLPLRDRNGEPIAAVRVVMRTFPGQTEQNAIVRATPIVKEMQTRVRSIDDLL